MNVLGLSHAADDGGRMHILGLPLDARLFQVRAYPAILRGEWAATSRAFRVWIGILLAGCGIGAICALILLPPGWEVMGTNPTMEWGLLIVAYAAFAVTTSGLCLTSSLGTVFGIERYRPLERRHAILAILSLVTAFGVIALELHWPIRMVFGVVLSPAPTSPMWWMGVAYGGYLVILLVEVWSMFAHRPRLHQAVCTMAACMAIVAPATLGAVFGALVTRPLWHGPVSSLYMLATALVAGCSLLAVVFGAVARYDLKGSALATPRVIPGLRLVLALFFVVSAGFVLRELVSGWTSREPGMAQAVDALTVGPLAIWFWVGRVILGLALPLLLLVLPVGRTGGGFIAVGTLGLFGAFIDRTLFVIGGLIYPVSSSTGGVVPTPYATYVPSLVELGTVLGAICFVALAYTLLERLLDLGIYDPHVGLSVEPIRRWRRARAAAKAAREAIDGDAPAGEPA